MQLLSKNQHSEKVATSRHAGNLSKIEDYAEKSKSYKETVNGVSDEYSVTWAQ